MFDPISDFWDPHPDPHCRVVSEPDKSFNLPTVGPAD